MEQPTQPTGMMGQLPPSSPAPAAPSQPGQGAGYNGVIVVDGEEITIAGGIGTFENDDGEMEEFYVSDDGSIVIDSDRNIAGRIEDGEFIEADEDQLERLRELGVLE